jgi:hypothetical protein
MPAHLTLRRSQASPLRATIAQPRFRVLARRLSDKCVTLKLRTWSFVDAPPRINPSERTGHGEVQQLYGGRSLPPGRRACEPAERTISHRLPTMPVCNAGVDLYSAPLTDRRGDKPTEISGWT